MTRWLAILGTVERHDVDFDRTNRRPVRPIPDRSGGMLTLPGGDNAGQNETAEEKL